MKRFLLVALVALATSAYAREGKCASDAAPPVQYAPPHQSVSDEAYLPPWHAERMARGYKALLQKVGETAGQLEADYGSAELGLIALGCKDQAPGLFNAIYRTGDGERDYWCARKAMEREEAGYDSAK